MKEKQWWRGLPSTAYTAQVMCQYIIINLDKRVLMSNALYTLIMRSQTYLYIDVFIPTRLSIQKIGFTLENK